MKTYHFVNEFFVTLKHSEVCIRTAETADFMVAEPLKLFHYFFFGEESDSAVKASPVAVCAVIGASSVCFDNRMEIDFGIMLENRIENARKIGRRIIDSLCFFMESINGYAVFSVCYVCNVIKGSTVFECEKKRSKGFFAFSETHDIYVFIGFHKRSIG